MKKSKHPPTDLFATTRGARPVDNAFATVEQLAALLPTLAIDEPFLRRHALPQNLNPKTKRPWLPKPIRGRWPVVPTLAGLAEWHAAQTAPTGFPEKFASIGDFTAQTPFNRDWLDLIRKKSPRKIVELGSRVNFRAFLEGIAAIGVQNLDVIDGDYEANRFKRAQADDRERQNAEREGEILWSKDRQFALAQLTVFDELMDRLVPFKKELLALAKTHGHEPEFRALLEKFLHQLPSPVPEVQPKLELKK